LTWVVLGISVIVIVKLFSFKVSTTSSVVGIRMTIPNTVTCQLEEVRSSTELFSHGCLVGGCIGNGLIEINLKSCRGDPSLFPSSFLLVLSSLGGDDGLNSSELFGDLGFGSGGQINEWL